MQSARCNALLGSCAKILRPCGNVFGEVDPSVAKYALSRLSGIRDSKQDLIREFTRVAIAITSAYINESV